MNASFTRGLLVGLLMGACLSSWIALFFVLRRDARKMHGQADEWRGL